MRQRAASVMRAVIMAAAATLLCGCTLSAALRHDEIRSVWGPGGALPPPTVYFATDRSPSGTGFSQSWGGVAHCGRARVPIANAVSPAAPDPALELSKFPAPVGQPVIFAAGAPLSTVKQPCRPVDRFAMRSTLVPAMWRCAQNLPDDRASPK